MLMIFFAARLCQFAEYPRFVEMAVIINNHAKFDGDDLTIIGNHCTGRGRRCTLTGNHIKIHDADGAMVTGNHCRIYCNDASTITDIGNHNKVYASKPGTVAAKPDRERDRSGASRVAVGGIAADTAYGCVVQNFGRGAAGSITIDSASGRRVVRGGIAADVVRGCTVIGHADGGTFVAPSGSGGDGTIRLGPGSYLDRVDGYNVTFGRDGGMVLTPTAPAAAASSSAATPLPRDHKCAPAADGEKSCIVCMTNRIDALLQPCGHLNLCVDCAAKIHAEKAECPTCRRTFVSVIAAVVGGADSD